MHAAARSAGSSKGAVTPSAVATTSVRRLAASNGAVKSMSMIASDPRTKSHGGTVQPSTRTSIGMGRPPEQARVATPALIAVPTTTVASSRTLNTLDSFKIAILPARCLAQQSYRYGLSATDLKEKTLKREKY
uniref:Uncharacterized protein n=1 Tax=Anopheles culicifacies TaxID=139723 RepID=A0A182MGP1_9DIPT